MKNRFCITKTDFYALLEQSQKTMLLRIMSQFIGTMTQQEMVSQMEMEAGAFNDAIKAKRTKFANKTANVEIVTAFQLADFYFPNLNPEICFEMREDFSPNTATSYDNIVAGIENDTAIDCTIKADGRQFDFQIKRYPQDYLPHTRAALTEYIKKTLAHYGNMRGMGLVLLLQPSTEERNDDLSFKGVHEDMVAIKDDITFSEIVFVFNDQMQSMRWQQVFPDYGYSEKPLVLLSEKYQAQQEEWKNKTV